MVKEHNLLQTLTRVNRPYKAMKFGHVVDFANIEEEYSKTNKDYQEELEKEVGQENTSSMDKLFLKSFLGNSIWWMTLPLSESSIKV